MSDHQHDYAGPDDCCHICGADRPPEPGSVEAAIAERDRYLAALHAIDTILMEGGTRDSIADVTRPFFDGDTE